MESSVQDVRVRNALWNLSFLQPALKSFPPCENNTWKCSFGLFRLRQFVWKLPLWYFVCSLSLINLFWYWHVHVDCFCLETSARQFSPVASLVSSEIRRSFFLKRGNRLESAGVRCKIVHDLSKNTYKFDPPRDLRNNTTIWNKKRSACVFMYSQSPNLLPRIVMEIRIQLFVQKIETNSKEETHVSPQCPRKPKKHIKLFFPKLIKKQTKSSLDPWINSYPPGSQMCGARPASWLVLGAKKICIRLENYNSKMNCSHRKARKTSKKHCDESAFNLLVIVIGNIKINESPAWKKPDYPNCVQFWHMKCLQKLKKKCARSSQTFPTFHSSRVEIRRPLWGQPGVWDVFSLRFPPSVGVSVII